MTKRTFDKQLCSEEGYYWISSIQLESLKEALQTLRKVSLSELKKNNDNEIEKCCGALFCSVGRLHTVLGQIEGTLEY